MAHWLEKVPKLLEAESEDLLDLADVAGYRAETFYIGVNPDGLDISEDARKKISFSESEYRIRRIKSTKKYEERLSLFLKYLVDENNNLGDIVRFLENYGKDKSEFINSAFLGLWSIVYGEYENLGDSRLTKRLGDSFRNYAREFRSFPQDDNWRYVFFVLVCQIIRQNVFAWSKVEFLYYISKNVPLRSSYKKYIYEWLENTTSSALAQFEGEIRKNLRESKNLG